MVSYAPVKFVDYSHHASGDIMVLVCLMFSEDHATRGSSNILGMRHPAKFGGHRHCGSGDILV